MLHNDRHLIPLNEVLYTFSSKGGVPTLGVDGLTQQLVRPALEGPVDSQDKVITTLACAARQSRASSRLLPGALGHNQYFCVECGEPAISFTTMCVSWLSARFWPAAGHPWIQSVGFAECSLACERAITDPQRLLRLFACAADGERVGGYETGDVVLSSTSMFPSCSPVAFPHPFVYAPWPLGLGPPMPVSDAGASASASASAVHQAAGTSSAAAAVDQAALTISHVIAPERDGTRASAAALAAPLAASSASRACANPTCRLPSGASVGDSKRLKQCSRCEKVRYCSVDCQKAHWRAGHKQACVPK